MTSNALELAHVHDRCPVIIERHEWRQWLTLNLTALYQFDKPLPAVRMEVEANDRLWTRG